MSSRILRFISAAALTALALEAGHPDWERLEKSGRWKLLRGQVEAQYKTAPHDGEVLLWRSKMLEAFGRVEDSYASAKEATQALPQSAEAWAQLASAAGQMAARANVLKKMGYGTECRDTALKALALDPKNLQAINIMINFYEQAPGFIGGDKAKAKAFRANLAGLDPNFAPLKAVNAAYQTKDPAGIDAAFKQAIQALPNELWPLLNAAAAAMDPKVLRTQDAQTYARKALELDPCNAWANGLLAQALAAEWKWTELDAALAHAEKVLPENYYPHYMTAQWLILASREPKRAEALLRRYLSQEPEAGAPTHAHAHWRLALALDLQGRRDEAVQEIRLAAKLLPKDKAIQADLKRLGG